MSFSEWKEVTLGEISIGNKGSYGIAASAVDYSENLYTYLRITDITDDGVLKKDSPVSVDDHEAKNYVLKPNDIVFARTGNSTGRSYFYDGSDGELVYAGFLIKFSLDPSKVNPKFIRYYTLSNEYKNWVTSFSTGSTRGNVNAKTYGNMKINLPSRKQQDFLVNILSTLDEKIEVNNKINKTLENMAQDIFKQWFVDFEFPNKDGEPYKSSGGEMVESELGMIPKGWKVGTISDIGTVIGGATPSKKKDEYYTMSGIPWITPKDLSENKNIFIDKGAVDITEEGFRSTSVKKMPIGTVLFSSRAPIGYIAISKNKVTTNQGFKSIIPNEDNGFGTIYIYCWLKENLEIIENRASGSTFKEISGGELKQVPAIIPQFEILTTFKKIDFFKNIEVKEDENKVLKNIRDSLLPKLMSGEIRVSLESDSQN